MNSMLYEGNIIVSRKVVASALRRSSESFDDLFGLNDRKSDSRNPFQRDLEREMCGAAFTGNPFDVVETASDLGPRLVAPTPVRRAFSDLSIDGPTINNWMESLSLEAGLQRSSTPSLENRTPSPGGVERKTPEIERKLIDPSKPSARARSEYLHQLAIQERLIEALQLGFSKLKISVGGLNIRLLSTLLPTLKVTGREDVLYDPYESFGASSYIELPLDESTTGDSDAPQKVGVRLTMRLLGDRLSVKSSTEDRVIAQAMGEDWVLMQRCFEEPMFLDMSFNYKLTTMVTCEATLEVHIVAHPDALNKVSLDSPEAVGQLANLFRSLRYFADPKSPFIKSVLTVNADPLENVLRELDKCRAFLKMPTRLDAEERILARHLSLMKTVSRMKGDRREEKKSHAPIAKSYAVVSKPEGIQDYRKSVIKILNYFVEVGESMLDQLKIKQASLASDEWGSVAQYQKDYESRMLQKGYTKCVHFLEALERFRVAYDL
jgi:hypothetical protein